jgi:hypothetical protein
MFAPWYSVTAPATAASPVYTRISVQVLLLPQQ